MIATIMIATLIYNNNKPLLTPLLPNTGKAYNTTSVNACITAQQKTT